MWGGEWTRKAPARERTGAPRGITGVTSTKQYVAESIPGYGQNDKDRQLFRVRRYLFCEAEAA